MPPRSDENNAFVVLIEPCLNPSVTDFQPITFSKCQRKNLKYLWRVADIWERLMHGPTTLWMPLKLWGS